MPSYNGGPGLVAHVAAALAQWRPVWVVIDGSTDGSDAALEAQPGLRIIRRTKNGGKGAAVLAALHEAGAKNFSHVLVLDADGQHPETKIRAFMRLSAAHPEAMILGQPVFGPDAPRARVWGRKLCNALARLETGQAVGDTLFGFRVYPLAPLRAVMQARPTMRGFDFDPEALVRLAWAGVPFLKCKVPVRYFRADEGGVSHFCYGRDNLRLAAMHARLIGAGLARRFRPSRR